MNKKSAFECLHSRALFLFADYSMVIDERSESITEHGLVLKTYTLTTYRFFSIL